MKDIQRFLPGLGICLAVAVASWFLGTAVPVIGGPVFAIVIGMMMSPFLRRQKAAMGPGVAFASKKILQYAVILLGFGMNLSVVLETGRRSLPIILATIATALVVAYILSRALRIPGRIATLIGVGSSICGGSAIAATAPVIGADDGEVAQAVSVIFFFNVLAAVLFPALGGWLGFDTASGEAFGIFAGTAINDTSSVTAAASTWDALYGLGSQTLDMAVTVKLTRTLAIIPITLVLAVWQARKQGAGSRVNLRKGFPMFILWFVLASVVTTVLTGLGVSGAVFAPFKTVSKFLIVMAMGAIGLNTDIVKLVHTGGKPLLMGAVCWVCIAGVSLAVQRVLGIW